MAEDGTKNEKNENKKTLQLSKTLSVGKIKQNISRGKVNTVQVEVKRRNFSSGSAVGGVQKQGDGKLSQQEQEARMAAVQSGKDKKERLAEVAVAEEEKKETKNVEKKQPVEDKKKSEEKAKTLPKKKGLHIVEMPKEGEDLKSGFDKRVAGKSFVQKKKEVVEEEVKQVKVKKIGGERKTKEKLTITSVLNQEEKVRSLASINRARQKAKRKVQGVSSADQTIVREVIIGKNITVQELSNRMAVRSQDVVKELMKLGVIAKSDDKVEADVAELVVVELGHKVKRVLESDVENILEVEINEDELVKRAPIVTIMGHVDHGKTSLLDAFRQSAVTEGEAGGITQHIGAYQTKTDSGEVITFLDTPGHEAFTEMRLRGAKVTDIVILVVAADDGIMPQTIEAINHAKAAQVPIIVAINKIDKPDANVKKVKDELLLHDIIPEDLGGDAMVVEISAKQKLNLDQLLDSIILQAEVMELKALDNIRAKGSVVEAKLEKGRGVVSTFLVQEGKLKVGDVILAGTTYGKIKNMQDDTSSRIKEAGPSEPVEVVGLNEAPMAGDVFYVMQGEKQARDIIEYRKKKAEEEKEIKDIEEGKGSLDNLFSNVGDKKSLNLIIKGDVQGSVEAIASSLKKLNNEEVEVKIVHSAVGGITPSDLILADATKAMVVGFNVRANSDALKKAEEQGTDVKYYSVIYDLIDDVRNVVMGLMAPIKREKYLGKAEIQQVFKITKAGKVAGCIVRDGVVKKGAGVRLIRDEIVIHEGTLKTLKRFKEEVKEVKDGTECGMAFENYEDIKEGDMIEAFEVVEEKRSNV